MKLTLLGTLTGALSAAGPSETDEAAAELVSLINRRINPPTPIGMGQIHIRSLRLVSDAINDHGGRFPADEHDRLCVLLVDSPVLIGHDRSRLPVARNFAARRDHSDGRQWVQVWFYWMRGEEGDRLAADIDGGVIKEGSIGFEFRRPQCSICLGDIRHCEHLPGAPYRDATGQTTIAHYEYREITRVLETSLVYRGATPDTRLGNEVLFAKFAESHPPPDLGNAVILGCKRLAPGRHRCIAAPCDDTSTPCGTEVTFVTPVRRRVGDRVNLSRLSIESNSHATHSPDSRPRDFQCGRALP